MKSILTFLLITSVLAFTAAAQTPKVSAKDLRQLEGGQWTGTLTYLDYSSKKKTAIRSNVNISRSSADKLTWTFDMQYPLEPGANKKIDVKLSVDGFTFDDETVVERTKLPNKLLRIVTTRLGKDDNREATFRHTYLIGKTSFSIRKDVRFVGEKEFFERNTYQWSR